MKSGKNTATCVHFRVTFGDLRTFQSDVWRIHSMGVRPLALVYQIVERTP